MHGAQRPHWLLRLLQLRGRHTGFLPRDNIAGHVLVIDHHFAGRGQFRGHILEIVPGDDGF